MSSETHAEEESLSEEEQSQCFCVTDESDEDEITHFTNPNDYDEKYPSRLRKLEEEQEQLNSSLIALTSHFAQVQLRLKQIVDAPAEDKENLLKELEQFAFRGVPDFREPDFINEVTVDKVNETDIKNKLEQQRVRQKELMQRLRDQLEELEKYAYDTGQSKCLPSSLLLERQNVIIEQLKGKLSLKFDEFDKSSSEDLRKQVDKAIKELVNPVIMKEQLVNQLKTQVTDLERFIEYLQINPSGKPRGKRGSKCTCNCPLHGNAQRALVTKVDFTNNDMMRRRGLKFLKDSKRQTLAGEEFSSDRKEMMSKMVRRFVTLLQLFTFAQFGCNRFDQNFGKTLSKRFSKGFNHWGDIRAKLEIVINRILEVNEEKSFNDSDYTSDGEECPILQNNGKMNMVIRREFCPILRDLIEHGLVDKISGTRSTSLLPSYLFGLGCLSDKSNQMESEKKMNAWDLILSYYQLKNGPQFKTCPARRLSQSFNLEIVGDLSKKPKHSLLAAIDDIIETHTKLRRSSDAHFKAFICEALNQRKLVVWLRLIIKNPSIIENFYDDWSYTSSTGFDDALASLDKLSSIKFKLPSDWAVRQLQSINEAFN